MVQKTVIYLIGSLRNPEIPHIGNKLREIGFDVFCDWHSAGPEADDSWQRYETIRGRSYVKALRGYAAQHVFQFDLTHLNRSDVGILMLPAGKSGHLELGYLAGQGKKTYILLDKEPERWDVMYNFMTGVFFNIEDLIKELVNGRDSPDRSRVESDMALGSTGEVRSLQQRLAFDSSAKGGTW